MALNQQNNNSECDYLFIFCSYNRAPQTLLFLRSLIPQIKELKLSHRICMLDDNSTDATKSLVKEEFPEIEVLNGAGNLFWAGGMREIYKTVSRDILYKHLVVLNDDIVLKVNALSILLDEYLQLLIDCKNMCMLSASFLDSVTLKTSYSGFVRRKYHPLAFEKVNSEGVPLEVDAINMNLALIPQKVILECGFLSDRYQHSKADIDYSIRVKEKGVRLFVSANSAGYCNANPSKKIIDIFSPKLGVFNNFKNPKGISFYEMYYFYSRNGKKGWQLFLALVYIKYIVIFFITRMLKFINQLNFFKK